MKRIFIITLCAGLVVSTSAQADKVYRWKDDDGKTHYGRTLPADHENRPYDVLDESGFLLEEVTDPLAAQQKPVVKKEKELEPLFSEDEVRVQSDRLLVLRYHTLDDIEDAMEVEVAQLGYDVRLINQTKNSAMTALTGQIKNAADRQRAGLPVEEKMENDINSLRQRILKSERSLAELKQREMRIRSEFQDDIDRYKYLQDGGVPGGYYNSEAATEDEADTGEGQSDN